MRFTHALVRLALPCLLLFGLTLPAHAAAPAPAIRLYVLDCGRIDLRDMRMFDDSGALDGQPGHMSVPCFLIHHPKGWLLFDTGLGDALAGGPGTDFHPGVHGSVRVTLAAQLKRLGLKPADIDYLAFSHWHADHTGNARLFPHATWIVQRRELDAATGANPPPFVKLSAVAAYRTAKLHIVDGDMDVFGDSTVRLLLMPGHTPGHQVLELRLPHAGVVLLSGDLYHTRENRRYRRVPRVNTDRAATLASMDRFEAIARNTYARVVIQHDPRDIAELPRLPDYLW